AASGVPSRGRFARGFAVRHGLAAAATLVRGGGPLRGVRRIIESVRYARDPSDGGRAAGEVVAVAVAPAWRGRGLGRELTASIVGALRARGCGRVRGPGGGRHGPARRRP